MAKKKYTIAKKGTNVNPTKGQTQNPPPDPSHPGQLLPPQVPGGPYYKRPGANG